MPFFHIFLQVIFVIEHIVRMNETVENILDIYQISIDELKENNLHITNFYNLSCGMKLLIPYLSKNVEQILESTEGFVQKYYPKVSEILEENKEITLESNIGKNDKLDRENIKGEKIVKDDIQNQKYIGALPPRKPYKGNIIIK